MRDDAPYYFECLRCGEQSHMADHAPRCPRCNSGNGIVTERQLPQPLATSTADTHAQAMGV